MSSNFKAASRKEYGHLEKLGLPNPKVSCWFQLQTQTAPSFLIFYDHRPSYLLVIGSENDLQMVLQHENLFEPGKHGFSAWFKDPERCGFVTGHGADSQFLLSNYLQRQQTQAIQDEYNHWISLLPSKGTSHHILSQFSPYPECLVYELVQNAVDAGATDIIFTMKTGKELVVEHNGRPFDLVDVHALTNFATSSKLPKSDSIGYKGIGFKSVFAVTSRVQISSPPFVLSYSQKVSGQYSYIQLDSCDFSAKAARNGMTTVSLQINMPDAVHAIRQQIQVMMSSNALMILNSLGKAITQMTWKEGSKVSRKLIPKMPAWLVGNHYNYRVVEDQNSHYLMVRSGDQPSNYICLCLKLTLAQRSSDGHILTFLPLEFAKRQFIMDIHAPFTVDQRRQRIEKDNASSKVWERVGVVMTFMMQALHKICQEPGHHEFMKELYWMLVPPERSPPRKAFEEAFHRTPLVLTLPKLTLENQGNQIIIEDEEFRPSSPYVDLAHLSDQQQRTAVLSLLKGLGKAKTNSSNRTWFQDFWEGQEPNRLIYVERATVLASGERDEHLRQYCPGTILQSTGTVEKVDIVWGPEAWNHAKAMVAKQKAKPLIALFHLALSLPLTPHLNVKSGGSYKPKSFDMPDTTISFLEEMKNLGPFVYFQNKFHLPSELLCSVPTHESMFPTMPLMSPESDSKVCHYEAMGIFRHDSLRGLINRLIFVKKEVFKSQSYETKVILSEVEKIYTSLSVMGFSTLGVEELESESLIFAPEEHLVVGSSWTAPGSAQMSILEKLYHDNIHDWFFLLGVPRKRNLSDMMKNLSSHPSVEQISELCRSLSRARDGLAEGVDLPNILSSPKFKLLNVMDSLFDEGQTPWAVQYGQFLDRLEKGDSKLLGYGSPLIHQGIIESCSPTLINTMRELGVVRIPTAADIVCTKRPTEGGESQFARLLTKAISKLNEIASKSSPSPLFPWKFCAMKDRELDVRIFDRDMVVRGIFFENTIYAHGYDNVIPALALALAVQPPTWSLGKIRIQSLLPALKQFFRAYTRMEGTEKEKHESRRWLENLFGSYASQPQPSSSAGDIPATLENDMISLNIGQRVDEGAETDEDNKEVDPDWEGESHSSSDSEGNPSIEPNKLPSTKPNDAAHGSERGSSSTQDHNVDKVHTTTASDPKGEVSTDERLPTQHKSPAKTRGENEIHDPFRTPKSDKSGTNTPLSTKKFIKRSPKSTEQREKDKEMGNAAEVVALRYERTRLLSHPHYASLPFLLKYPNEDKTELLETFVCSTAAEPLSFYSNLLPDDYNFSQTAPWDIHSYEFIEGRWTRIRLEVKSSSTVGSRSFKLSSGEYKHLKSTLEEGEFPYIIYFYSGFAIGSPVIAPTYRLYFSKPEDFDLIDAVPTKYELKILGESLLMKQRSTSSSSASPSHERAMTVEKFRASEEAISPKEPLPASPKLPLTASPLSASPKATLAAFPKLPLTASPKAPTWDFFSKATPGF